MLSIFIVQYIEFDFDVNVVDSMYNTSKNSTLCFSMYCTSKVLCLVNSVIDVCDHIIFPEDQHFNISRIYSSEAKELLFFLYFVCFSHVLYFRYQVSLLVELL